MTGAEEYLDFQAIDSYPQRTAYHGVRAGVKFLRDEQVSRDGRVLVGELRLSSVGATAISGC